MRRGIKWKAIHPPGIDHLAPDASFMGYPLRHVAGRVCAEARGVWIWKWIAVGDSWFKLTGAEQQAVLLHEVGHHRHFHFEKRLFLLPIFWSAAARRVTQLQEMQADEYAVRLGYGRALLHFIGENHMEDGEFYPPFGERVQNIFRLMSEVNHELAA